MATRRTFIKQVVGVGAGVASGVPASAQAGGEIAGFDHVAVPMRNTDAMLAFYRRLGFSVRENERICSVHMAEQKINFHRPSLWESGTFDLRAAAAEPPCGDFCFVWSGDIPSLHARLDAAGADIILGPCRTPGRCSWRGRDGDQLLFSGPRSEPARVHRVLVGVASIRREEYCVGLRCGPAENRESRPTR